AVSFYGANIFPEMISVALEGASIAPHVTGKFVMEVGTEADENKRLRIAVELAPGTSEPANFAHDLARAVLAELRAKNSEFSNYVPAEWQLPLVTLWPAGHAEYFPAGVKHRYSR